MPHHGGGGGPQGFPKAESIPARHLRTGCRARTPSTGERSPGTPLRTFTAEEPQMWPTGGPQVRLLHHQLPRRRVWRLPEA